VVGVKEDGGDLAEVATVFVPRGVPLSRLTVSSPDSQGKLIIKAP
jgi:hypothetical protein